MPKDASHFEHETSLKLLRLQIQKLRQKGAELQSPEASTDLIHTTLKYNSFEM